MKSKIPGAMPDKMPKGKIKKRREDSTRIGKKEGGPVGLYANMNASKAKGISRSKSKSTITPEAYANMKAGFPKGKK